ncbi:uncharacterized protein LOC122501927 [Leptopilina heterotoma]|uniref:uncharacterized protein LOC122501927 n=1 Tax=Leptopilina heterotoma TaxID=63436 RepID=UPI001CA88FFE|nr:uncharacterized protein LOC122501927 [Leptopilina heterotoma]
MVHGRPRHPQTQGSVERANGDVENMLRAWIIDNKSIEWARGCYEVQWMKNASKHRTINRAPYEAVFGPVKNGLASFNLPQDVAENLNTEEELEIDLLNLTKPDIHQEDQAISTVQTQDESKTLSKGQSQDEIDNNELLTETRPQKFCSICHSSMDIMDAVSCSDCHSEIHFQCGDQVDVGSFICNLCARGKHLLEVQDDCNKRQKAAAEKMVTFSQELFPPLSIGDCVTMSVPSVDRGPLDFNKIFGVVTDFRNGVYQVGTKSGIINGWFCRTELQKSAATPFNIENVQKDVFFTL